MDSLLMLGGILLMSLVLVLFVIFTCVMVFVGVHLLNATAEAIIEFIKHG